jgi:hypothetical protein
MKKLILLALLLVSCNSQDYSANVLDAEPKAEPNVQQNVTTWQGFQIEKPSGLDFYISIDGSQLLLIDKNWNGENAPYATFIVASESHAEEMSAVSNGDYSEATYDSEFDGEGIFWEAQLSEAKFLDVYTIKTHEVQSQKIFNQIRGK